MKKPPVEHPFDRLSVRAWREEVYASDMSDDEKALQDTKERLEKDHKKALAEKIKGIIEKHCTKRQQEIFNSFIETENFSVTAELLGIKHPYVIRTVDRVKEIVKEQLGTVRT